MESGTKTGDLIIASAGMLLYRYKEEGGIEILVGRRRTDPWKGYEAVVFGGLAKPEDASGLETALREAREETGGDLKIRLVYPYPIGSFGPRSYHHLITYTEEGGLEAIPTETLITVPPRFSITVFAGLVMGGEPKDTREVENFRFVEPVEFTRGGVALAFEQALALVNFWKLYHSGVPFPNPRVTSWFFSTAV